jgi:hypothetical protein
MEGTNHRKFTESLSVMGFALTRVVPKVMRLSLIEDRGPLNRYPRYSDSIRMSGMRAWYSACVRCSTLFH